MLPTNKTFRIFVSSTFRDFEAERNALQLYVFPRLSQFCQQRGVRFETVDLRWGISAEAGRKQLTMGICLGEIARSQRLTPRPNFLLLLGERYGWRPLPTEIPAGLFRRILQQTRAGSAEEGPAQLQQFYLMDRNARPAVWHLRAPRSRSPASAARREELERELLEALEQASAQLGLPPAANVVFGASATEQEAWAGALNPPPLSGQALVFVRKIVGLPKEKLPAAFVDVDATGQRDASSRQRLEALKKRLLYRLGTQVHEFTVAWQGGGISTEHLDPGKLASPEEEDARQAVQDRASQLPGSGNFCKEVYEQLTRTIQNELSAWQPQTPLNHEIGLHENFLQEWGNRDLFCGRGAALNRIARHLVTPASCPLTVWGESGVGKSALLARAVLAARHKSGSAVTISRFLGVTPESSNARSLLEGLCSEIAAAYGDTQREVPKAYLDLLRDFPDRLGLARRERPLVLFLDALDQLSDATLNWLPQVIPDHGHLVISTLAPPHPCLTVLRSRYPRSSFLQLGGLTSKDGDEVLKLWLRVANRTLQAGQRQTVLRAFGRQGLPLWLKLAFAEARRWRSYQSAPELPTTVQGLIQVLFRRLAQPSRHGALLVNRSLGYLAAARQGLTEDELLAVLSLDQEFFRDFLQRSFSPPPDLRLPAVVWSRLFFDLEPYLAERQGDGTNLLGFFHRQFREVVLRRFLSGRSGLARHAALARYFARQPNVFAADRTMAPNLRKLSELPYQQLQARRWPSLTRTLCDLSFVEAKCAAGMVFDLIADYDRALAAPNLPGNARRRLKQFAQFVRSHNHLLAENPQLTFQTALNEPDSSDLCRAARRRAGSGREKRPYLRWMNKGQEGSSCQFECVGHRDVVNSCDVSPDGTRIVSASSDGDIKLWNARSGLELRTISLLRASVETCAFSPDGVRIVSGTRDGRVQIWNADTGQELVRTSGHREAVATCAFSPDGTRIVSASYDQRLKIWDARGGRQVHSLRGHNVNVVSCGFSPDGSRLVSGSTEGGLRIWNASTGRELLELDGHEHGVWRCAFSPDGSSVFSASEDGTLKSWDAATGKLLQKFVGHKGPVWTCAISPDGRRLASGSKDRTIRLWDAATGREMACLAGHAEAIWGMAFFPNGRELASASWDWSVRVWNIAAAIAHAQRIEGRHKRPVVERAFGGPGELPQDGPAIACACSPDGRWYAAGCSDGSVRFWDTATGSARGTFRLLGNYVTALGFSPDGHWLMVGGWDGGLKLIDLGMWRAESLSPSHRDQVRNCTFSRDGTCAVSSSAEKVQLWRVTSHGLRAMRSWQIRKKTLRTCDLSPDRAYLVVGQDDGNLSLWSVGGARRLKLGLHPDLVFCSFSPDGHSIVSSSREGQLKLWDVRRRRQKWGTAAHTGPVESCRFSPNSARIVSSGWDHTIQVRALGSPIRKQILRGHTDQLQDACFNADGTKVLSVGMDGSARVWAAATGTALGFLMRPSNRVCACVFSPDGTSLASASHRHSLKLWSMDQARAKAVLTGHTDDVMACAFSPDGRCLVSAASDNTLKLWEVQSGQELATFTGHLGPVISCEFSPDGKTILSGSKDGTVRIWNASAGRAPRTLQGHGGWVQEVRFSGDGRLVFSFAQDGTLRIWAAASGRCLEVLSGQRGAAGTFAVSGDGRLLASASADGRLRVWKVRRGSPALVCSGHVGAVTSAAFSADGSQIVFAASDHKLRLWDTRNGRLKRTFSGHAGPILSCAFSRTGEYILSGSEDHFAKVWDPNTGAELCAYRADAAVAALAWHPNRSVVAIGDTLGQVYFLELHSIGTRGNRGAGGGPAKAIPMRM